MQNLEDKSIKRLIQLKEHLLDLANEIILIKNQQGKIESEIEKILSRMDKAEHTPKEVSSTIKKKSFGKYILLLPFLPAVLKKIFKSNLPE